MFKDVRVAMRKLLDHIQESGELERYWNIVEKENDEARKAARKLEKERRRLEMGSDYEMSADEDDEDDESNANGQYHKKSPKQDDEYYSDDVNNYLELIEFSMILNKKPQRVLVNLEVQMRKKNSILYHSTQ